MGFFNFISDFFENADDVNLEHPELDLDGIDKNISDLHTNAAIPFDYDLNHELDFNHDIEVLMALDRITNDIDGININQASDYIQSFDFDTNQFNGLVNNWKGVYGEIRALDELRENSNFNLEYVIPKSTTNPGVDIYGLDEGGNIAAMYQVKMSLNKNYIQETLNDLPEGVSLICPSEIAEQFSDERIIDLGISHVDLMEDIENVTYVLSNKEPWEAEIAADENFLPWLNSSLKPEDIT